MVLQIHAQAHDSPSYSEKEGSESQFDQTELGNLVFATQEQVDSAQKAEVLNMWHIIIAFFAELQRNLGNHLNLQMMQSCKS